MSSVRAALQMIAAWMRARAAAATTLTGLVGPLDEFDWEGEAMRWTPEHDRTAA